MLMYCSDIKLAESLERDDGLEAPETGAQWQSAGGESLSLHGVAGHVAGTREWRGLSGAGSAGSACCLQFPVLHHVTLHPCLFCVMLQQMWLRHRGIGWLTKGRLGHGGAWGRQCDVFLKDEEKAVPSGALRNICRLASGVGRLLLGRLIRF